tara:strand:+ start:207 stop:494 length:288 start_codon:yes stop_codon:yes gene_type:complete
MKKSKITINYQATEPAEYVYIVTIQYGEDGHTFKTVYSNQESLLKYRFEQLDYEKLNETFIPKTYQSIYNLKKEERNFGDFEVNEVTIESKPLYL